VREGRRHGSAVERCKRWSYGKVEGDSEVMYILLETRMEHGDDDDDDEAEPC
jgi:hypothetical protein